MNLRTSFVSPFPLPPVVLKSIAVLLASDYAAQCDHLNCINYMLKNCGSTRKSSICCCPQPAEPARCIIEKLSRRPVFSNRFLITCGIDAICFVHKSGTSMATIKYADIPLWLRSSDFYLSLNSDEADGLITIPTDCFSSAHESVGSVEDLLHVLRVMRFWGAKCIPESVLEFCCTTSISIWGARAAEILIPEVKLLQDIFTTSEGYPLEIALQTGRQELCDFWLIKNSPESKNGQIAIAQACRYGRLDLVKTLHASGFALSSDAICAAAQYGHLNVLVYLQENGCPWKGDAFKYAFRGGQVECVKYLFQEHCPWEAHATLEFAVPEHYRQLILLSQHYNMKRPWTDDWTITPPEKGYLECLRFALDNGCKRCYGTCGMASKYGLLDCLQLFHLHNVPWEYGTATEAASAGHLHCLTYLHENGCTLDEGTAEGAARHGHLDCLRYIVYKGAVSCEETLLEAAAEAGSAECLAFLVEHFHFDLNSAEYSYGVAFVRHNVAAAQYLLNVGSPFTPANHPCPNQMVDVTSDETFLPYLTYAIKHSWEHTENLSEFVTWCNSSADSGVYLPLCQAFIEEELQCRQL